MVLSDYAKGALQDIESLISLGRKQRIPVVVDPKGTNFDKYRGATLITPNFDEFEAVVGRCANEVDLVNKGTELVEKLELEAVLVTRGEQGMTLIRPGSPELHLPAKAQEVFDVTGAGDTVISVLAALILMKPMPRYLLLPCGHWPPIQTYGHQNRFQRVKAGYLVLNRLGI